MCSTIRYGPRRAPSSGTGCSGRGGGSSNRSPASSCASISDSTSCRSSASASQTRVRYSSRSSGGRRRETSRISLICFQRSGYIFRLPANLAEKPGLGGCPVALCGGRRHLQDLGCLFNGESREKAQFDEAALPRIHFGQTLQRVIQPHQVQIALAA